MNRTHNIKKKAIISAFFITVITILAILLFFLEEQYFAKNQPLETPMPVETQKPTPTPQPTPTPNPHLNQEKSKVTGEWITKAIAAKRPIAVMLNNSKAALPQSGLASASVIYEAAMEGDETRLMGIFEDYETLKRVGSIRSCRPYFVYFALEFNAIYCHFGQAWVADDILKNSSIDTVSGLKDGSDAYYRSTDRKAPHNVFTDYIKMEDTITKLGYDRNYSPSTSGHYQFVGDGETVDLTNGILANYVKPGFPVNKPWFEYNSEEGLYYRFQYGLQQIDECNGEQIKYKNIILQYTDSTIYEGSSYVNFDVLGGGNGFFITNGKAIDVTWKKDSTYGITRYYNSDGREIRLNQGKTWVCILKTRYAENTLIEGTRVQ